MNPRLTEEMRAALRQQPGRPVRVEDEETQKVYVIIDDQTHQRAMEALRQQEDLTAIQAGIDDMEAERVIPCEEVDARIRNKLGLPPRS